MKQEDKLLLVQDLCSRLSYGVKVGTVDSDGSLENVWDVLWYNVFTEDVKLINSVEDADKLDDICEVRPYLFPLSSLTEEQRIMSEDWDMMDWFNTNHFDYRGLIERNLAIDATGKNIY